MEISKRDRIFVTGHRGLLGSSLVEVLRTAGYTDVVTAARAELDLTDRATTRDFIARAKPRAILHAAALVGGITANMRRPAEFIEQNISMQNNVIHGAHLADVQKLIFFGSNCMYPVGAPQPMAETLLLTGPIEPSNLAYGAAKIAGYVQCQSYFQQYGRDYFSIVPASLYGPGDNFDLETGHVTATLLRRMHEAKIQGTREFIVWGTGKPRRELLLASDAAEGVVHLLETWTANKGAVNLGAGDDLSVREIAEALREVVGFRGDLVFDTSKPDGSQRKLLDSSRSGFRPKTGLTEGLKRTYEWFLTAPRVRGLRGLQ